METVVCLTFARVRNSQGAYALVESYSALMGYEPGLLLPPGGQLEMHPEGRAFLESIGVPGMIGSNALQFCVPDGTFSIVEAWFRRRIGRQSQMGETVVGQLLPSGGRVTSASFAGFVTNHTRFPGRQSRFGEDMRLAQLVEVYDVTLDRAPHAGASRNARVVFATAEQIASGSINRRLINPIVPQVIGV